MINIENLELLKQQNKGILNSYFTSSLDYTNYEILPYDGDVWQMRKKVIAENEQPILWTDDPYYILRYTTEVTDTEYSDILIIGLGMGVMPFVCKDVSNVDVIEINQEIIDIVTDISHLNGVNIINADAFTYTPTKLYDIILIDIWECDDCISDLDIQMETLINKYLPHIRGAGFVYIPINIKRGDVIFRNIEYRNT